MAEIKNYKVAISPHKLDSDTTRRLMLDVIIALLPCLVCGVLFFGLYALLLVVICTATCFVSEQIYNLLRKKPLTFDLSAVVTGLILGLNLPARAPWYIPIVGGVIAIIFVKMFFGGLGKNFANPAATARVFLLLTYGSVMAKYIGADISGNFLADGTTSATYLGGGVSALAGNFFGVRGYWGNVLQLFFGYVGGCIGETCVPAILAGGAYLIARRVIDWRIPLVYLLTAAFMTLVCFQSAGEILLQLFSGGLMFGAFFMATDYATSPKWKINRILFAFGLGVLTVLIRRFGSFPEGVSLAILFMNLLVPVMDRYLVPVRFGQQTKSGRPKPQIMKWLMRGLCVAMALVLAIAVPVMAPAEWREYKNSRTEVEIPASYEYVRSFSLDAFGNFYFDTEDSLQVPGGQEVKFTIGIGTDYLVSDIVPEEQSDRYTAELSLFLHKSYSQISGLQGDLNTGATVVNTSLKNMILECYKVINDSGYANRNYPVRDAYAYVDSHARAGFGGEEIFGVSSTITIREGVQQDLKFIVRLADGKVSSVLPVEQSGRWQASLALFLGKTYAEVAAISDLQAPGAGADGVVSATKTNTALKNMILECFLASDLNADAYTVGSAEYVQAAGASALFGGVSFLAGGEAYLAEYDYRQPLVFYINLAEDRVANIIPITQSTVGFTAELSFFLGKTRAEIFALTDLGTGDATSSATRTNTALKEMILECFDLLENFAGGDAQ